MRVRLKRDAVEAALVRRNWTKLSLARLAGLHRTHLSDLLAGRANAGPQTRQRLLEILGGDFDDYFEIIHEEGDDRGGPHPRAPRSSRGPTRRRGRCGAAPVEAHAGRPPK